MDDINDILTDLFLVKLSKKILIVNVAAVDFSAYLGFTAADGQAAAMGAINNMNPSSAYNTLLSKFVMRHGRKSESAQNLRKRFLQNGMEDHANDIKAELEKFITPVPSDAETLKDSPVSLPNPPSGTPGKGAEAAGGCKDE
ncbi:uncharacterized protein LOC105441998 [Strongylocentrotus purpuratus]|uniref:Uncharacterized protein n=1 Tax=Strongylocentrotus purpuratus TaxID=7668 RepID=A0A7M7HFS4_STRPU|nr:uncharacterized protein LOC105441998 [Strongylocentrotus purpuratus]XP_030832155.1 uncharacterized protein LOC105441998 [Strongylocentrotus purpuratus]|eukprot:XP_011672011.1 PREDICTED: uncharacterized protein LOC105441998 [Strongylocentrotus purpuratus]